MRALSERPTLSGRTRIKYDRFSTRFLLLAPERGLILNRTAHEVVELCASGKRSVGQVIDELHERYPEVDMEKLGREVCELLDALERRALLRFES